MAENILIAILGGGNLLLFAKFLIERMDRKKERAEDQDYASINSALVKLEKDGLRTQLLLMILLRPEEKKEIMTLAGVNATVSPCTTAEFPRPAKRPAYSCLENMMLKATVGDNMRDWKEALKAYFENQN